MEAMLARMADGEVLSTDTPPKAQSARAYVWRLHFLNVRKRSRVARLKRELSLPTGIETIFSNILVERTWA